MTNTINLLTKWAKEGIITEAQKELVAKIWSSLGTIEGFGVQLSDTLKELVHGNHVTGNSIRNQVIDISRKTAGIEENIVEVLNHLLSSMDVPEEKIKEIKTEIRVDLMDIIKSNQKKEYV